MAPRVEPTRAFSRLAKNYAAARPEYPAEVYDLIARRLRLRRNDWVMDLGSGTGISTRPLVERGYRVVAVEPNPSMLATARRLHPRWRFVRARAERLPFKPVFRAIVCAQTFHWFDRRVVMPELARISRGLAAFWNSRDPRDPFMRDYERMIRRYNRAHIRSMNPGRAFGPRSAAVSHRVRFTRARFLTFTRSVSYIANYIKGPNLRRFLADVSARFGPAPRSLPYTTQLWLLTRARRRRWTPAR